MARSLAVQQRPPRVYYGPDISRHPRGRRKHFFEHFFLGDVGHAGDGGHGELVIVGGVHDAFDIVVVRVFLFAPLFDVVLVT